MSNQQWRERPRPKRLERRYEFESYDALRNFLDDAADLSDREGLYPDMGFARDYVNITIYPEEGSVQLTDKQHRFARLLDDLQ
ncbi:MAG: pterin-4-alpha-carbinolamine dehydratase [Candidatus Thiodiazotropha sp.]